MTAIMTQIQSFRNGVAYAASQILSVTARFARVVIQSNTGRLSVALAIIAATVYWWKSQPSLQGRVTHLEKKVEDFWRVTAKRVINHPRTTTPNVLEGRISLELAELQKQVGELPSDRKSELTDRIKALYDAVMIAHELPEEEQCLKTLTLTFSYEQELTELPWRTLVTAYEECAKNYLGQLQENTLEDDVKNSLDQHKAALLLQIGEVYKKVKDKSELLSCLLLLHAISRSLTVEGVPIGPAGSLLSSHKFGGLARGSNNSCYLATALQLFRVIDRLRSKFDPDFNRLQDPKKVEIQGIIHGMLARMDEGKTIPVHEGEELQRLIKDVEIIDGQVHGMYDAGEVASRLLYLMGFELSAGQQSITRHEEETEELINQVNEEYHPFVPLSGNVDVGRAIKQLTESRAETVKEDKGNIKHVYQVTSLSEFMVVEFLGRDPQLSNVEKFDDPLNPAFKYELVFGMENTGAHWIAHVLCAENQWMTANDESIHSMNPESLSRINRGYYVRKAKS